MIGYLRRWWRWQKQCINSPWYKLMVLLGVRRSSSFYLTLDPKEELDIFGMIFEDGCYYDC